MEQIDKRREGEGEKEQEKNVFQSFARDHDSWWITFIYIFVSFFLIWTGHLLQLATLLGLCAFASAKNFDRFVHKRIELKNQSCIYWIGVGASFGCGELASRPI